MKLTLDWNCVIEIEEGGPQAEAVWTLVNYHRAGIVEVGLLAASASENSRSKRFPGNATIFLERVEKLGISDLPLIPMPMIISLSYIHFAYIVKAGPEYEAQFTAIWNAMAPNISRAARDHLGKGQVFNDEAVQSPALAKWRNTWCDVMSAYCHIKEGRDVFVTNNTRDFQRNAAALAALGLDRIATPKEAAEIVHPLER